MRWTKHLWQYTCVNLKYFASFCPFLTKGSNWHFYEFSFFGKNGLFGSKLNFFSLEKNFLCWQLGENFLNKEVTDRFLDFVFWQKEVNDCFASFCQKKVSLTSFCEKIFFRKLSVTSFFNLFLVEVYWQSKDLVFLTTNKHYEKNNETQN